MRLILNVDCRCPEKRCPVHLETEVKYNDTDTLSKRLFYEMIGTFVRISTPDVII